MLRYFAHSIRNFRLTPDYSDHRLNWEIWVTFEGKVRPVFHDAPNRRVPEANFWVMPPGTRYRWEAETEEVDRAVIHFAYVPAELDQVARARTFACRVLAAAELTEARVIARNVGEAFQRRDLLSPLYFQRAALDLALLALRGEPSIATSTMETHAADRAERALAWYMEHVYEAPKFDRLAAEMNMSTSHLRRLFHSHFGKSPKAVFDRVRMERATMLLTSSTATLDEVASRAGFHSTSDFCRVFKKHFSHSPNVWRRGVGVVKTHEETKVSAGGELEVKVNWPVRSAMVARSGNYSIWPGNRAAMAT